LRSLFSVARPVLGMIHVAALPGTPAGRWSVAEIVALATREAEIYRAAGLHGLVIENMHDTPYCRGQVGPEVVAAMTVVAGAVKAASGLPCGLQILAAANREALAVALATGLDFIRAEGFVFAHVADEGLIQSCAAELLRYRRLIGAEHVQVWADVKKKHSAHAITADVSLGETAHAVEFMRGDAVIVTGAVTGDAPAVADLNAAKAGTHLPVYLGSGVTAANVSTYAAADGFIIGSEFKVGGRWDAAVDPARVDRFLAAWSAIRP